MKKIFSFMVVAAVLALGSIVHAGERAGAFSISPYVGGYMYDEKDQILTKNRPLIGVRFGYDITDSFGAEFVTNYVRAEYNNTNDRISAFSYRLDLLYNFMPRSLFVPYLAVGGGGETIRYYEADGGDTTDGTFSFGGGFKYFFTDDVAFRGDARHIIDFSYRTIRNWEYSVGVSFLFGGRQAAAAALTPAAAPVTPAPAPAVEQAEPPLPPARAAEPARGRYKYCITLQGEFDIDQAVIRPEYHEEIAEVGNFMKKYPSTTAVIEGHTDNVGTYNHNMDLSQRRAEAVVNHLVQKFGIDRSRLSAKGYGFTRPIADNASDEGRQKNRRMEAIIDCVMEVQEIKPTERLCMGLVLDFDSGKADIKPQYRAEIARVADYMKRYPSTTALIEGHTDNTGTADGNMKLSQQRAEAVVTYLVDNFGIDRSRLAAKGYGSTMRIAYNSTPEGRQKNRRINAVIDCVVKR